MGTNLKSKSQILIKGNVMEVHTKGAPFLANSFIGFLAASMFLLPILTTVMLLVSGDGLQFVLFITFGLFWFFSYLMTRQFLWNVYGKEVLTFKNRKITYYSDFKFFQDSHKEIDVENFDVYVLEVQEWDVKLGKVVFTNMKEEIELAIKIPLHEAKSVVEGFLERIPQL